MTYDATSHKHPKLGIKPSNTVQSVKKPRGLILNRLYTKYKIYWYNIDFSSCHLRIVQYFTTSKEWPLFHTTLENNNFWTEIGITYQSKFHEVRERNVKVRIY